MSTFVDDPSRGIDITDLQLKRERPNDLSLVGLEDCDRLERELRGIDGVNSRRHGGQRSRNRWDEVEEEASRYTL